MSFRRLSNFRTFISASRAKRCTWITSRREEPLAKKSEKKPRTPSTREADVLKRLDVMLLSVSPGDTGWDVFSLDYHTDGPIRTVRGRVGKSVVERQEICWKVGIRHEPDKPELSHSSGSARLYFWPGTGSLGIDFACLILVIFFCTSFRWQPTIDNTSNDFFLLASTIKILGVSQNLWKCLCKTVNLSVTSKKLCCIWKSVQFSTCWCHSKLTLVFSMDALGAFPIACRRQWRTPNTRVRTMHVEHQMENMFLPKAEMQYWGHCGIGNVLPKIVKLPNIHQRPTHRKMRMDYLSSRSALANFERSALFRKSASSLQRHFHKFCDHTYRYFEYDQSDLKVCS